MTNNDRLFGRELRVAIRAVREAARLCRAVATGISGDVLAKNDKSPVTVADFGSQALICRELIEAFPDDPVIAEEDAAALRLPENRAILDRVVRHVRATRASAADAVASLQADQICEWIDHGKSGQYHDRFWTLDPIDGTKGFLRGEQYAIALALIVGGEVVVAALACPQLGAQPSRRREANERSEPDSRGAIFTAVKGEGALGWAAESSEDAEPAAWRLQVNDTEDPAEARFCESVESGHSAHGDSAGLALRLGITAAPAAHGQPGQVCGGGARRGRDLSQAAHPRRVSRKDLGSRRRWR